jgi:predicted anti-sigma-YlaC factor YlaD
MKNFDCTDIKALLSGFVDDELEAGDRHQVERHIAECASCTTLVTEAEALNALIASDAASLTAGAAALPEGFEAGVLSRTIYAEAYHAAGHRWASWFGWVAAAAALGLAASIYFLDRGRMTTGPELLAGPGPGAAIERDAAAASGYQISNRSTIVEGGVLPDTYPAITLVSRTSSAVLDEATRQQIAEQLALVQPSGARRGIDEISQHPALSGDDADALYATANVLDMLAATDLTSFADIETARQIAVYDELLPRLAAARTRLPVADRPAVLAAESILLRIVEGPINLDDARLLTDTARSMDLSGQLARVSNRWQPVSSL